MKFLQKHIDQPEAVPPTVPDKKCKKDHAYTQQEEISAYFTTIRPALKEKDLNIQAKEGARKKRPTQLRPSRDREQSSVVDNAIPTIELVDKAPFLGLRDRGPRHETSSYISWSESIRVPSAPPIRAPTGSIVNGGRPSSIHGGRHGLDTGGAGLHSQAVPRHLTDSSSSRFNMSSLGTTNRRASRSHSFPQRTCSPQRAHRDDRSRRRRASEIGAAPSSMPSALPVRSEPNFDDTESVHLCSAAGSQRPLENAGEAELSVHKEDSKVLECPDNVNEVNPATLSSMGRLLRECNSVFDDERRQTALSIRSNNTTLANTAKNPLFGTSHGAIRSLPTVRFSGVEILRPRMPSYMGRGIYEEQALREELELLPYMDDENLRQVPYSLREAYDDGNGEMHNAEQEWEGIQEEEIYPYEAVVESRPDVFVQPDMTGNSEDTRMTDRTGNIIARGFWRPHRFY